MNIQTETVQIPGGTPDLSAYLARPTDGGKFPGVVVIHEAFGLNDNIRGIADRFAAEGYVALAVDLFAGRNKMVCMFRFFGGQFLNSLDHGGIKDLKVALGSLEKRPDVESGKIGAIGFCMGGGFAIAWACTDPRLKVIAPFYGILPRPLEAVARSCPVVGSYPENDFTRSGAVKLDAELAKHHIPHDIKIYPNSKHSFMNEQRGNYNPEASADAWQRTLTFFRESMVD